LLKSGKASESEIYAKIEEYKEKFADYGRDRRSAMEFHLRNVERLLMPTQTTNFIMNTLKDSDDAHGSADTVATAATKILKIEEGGEEQTITPTPTPATVASTSTTTTNTNTNTTIPAMPNPNVASSTTTSTPMASTSSSPSLPPKTSKELFTRLVKIIEVTPAQAAALKDSRFVAQEMDETLNETLDVLKELRGRLAQCGQDLDTEFNCIRQILTPSQSAKFLVWVAQNKACMHMLSELWSKNYSMVSTAEVAPSASRSGSFED